MSTTSAGKEGEVLAVQYLLQLGHSVLEQNFRNKTGEIDIISLKEGTIFFVEVKTWQKNFIHPLESFTNSKMNKMRNLAGYFFYKKNWKERDYLVSFCLIFINRGEVEFHKDLF
ncbi:MAG: YraN family protein [Leptospiraceae bacterium]|nr:YraN family protein [Leptospiraceae bacterium]